MYKKTIKTRAFTLIEIIVVLVILSTLSAVAMLSYSDVTKSYKEAVAKTNLQVLKSAVQIYRLEHSGLFPTNLISSTNSKDALEYYLDDDMVSVLSNPNNPYQYSLKILSENLVIRVKGPHSFEEEIVVSK